jgi:hypothetical protein
MPGPLDLASQGLMAHVPRSVPPDSAQPDDKACRPAKSRGRAGFGRGLFAGSRRFAEEWTFRFFGAAIADHDGST